MSTEAPKKRSLLIIDGAYLISSLSKISKRVDFVKLVYEIEQLISNEFYEKWFLNSCVMSHPQTAFHNMLRAAPPKGPQFRVKLFGLKSHAVTCRKCRYETELTVQKGVDVGIATLLLKHSFQNLCDQVILLAGDGDFFDALATVKDELRKDLWVIGFRDGSLSLDLQQIAKVIWIDDFLQRIEIGPIEPVLPQENPPPKSTAKADIPPSIIPKQKPRNKQPNSVPKSPQKPRINDDEENEEEEKEKGKEKEKEKEREKEKEKEKEKEEKEKEKMKIEDGIHFKPAAPKIMKPKHQNPNRTILSGTNYPNMTYTRNGNNHLDINLPYTLVDLPSISHLNHPAANIPNLGNANNVSENPNLNAGNENAVPDANTKVWTCKRCTLDNGMSLSICEACEAPKPEDTTCPQCGFLQINGKCAFCAFFPKTSSHNNL